MEAWDQRRIGERRQVNQHNGEGRRTHKERRTADRRHGARGGWADGGKFDRRGEHPSLFATLGFLVLRGGVLPR